MATHTARAILSAGLVSLDIWNEAAQEWSGFGEALDADKFEIKPDFEEKISTSRSHLDWGQARASVILPKPTEISIELSAASAQALAMQFQGMVQAFSQAAGSLSAQAFTVPAAGHWLALGARQIQDAGFVITNSAGASTYVQGTHYEVNWARGEVRFFLAATGAPLAGDEVRISAQWSAFDASAILGGRVAQVRCKARFDGKNMVDGRGIEVDVHECVLASSSGFDFLGDDFTPIALEGKVVTPRGKTEGYEIRLL